ncbi:MAG: hypothetical protein FJY95_11105 [Candidatus Handelsmanbacteria bacterium]|nr:hypothetical protein [Candidatus Handelsmanbacteria bacterium]
MRKRTERAPAPRPWWGALLILLWLGAGEAGAESAYVIRVNPALIYLDAGAQQGAAVGEIYAVFRPEEAGDLLVGLVNVIRVQESFCIAEVGYRAEGEHFELLQRAMPLKDWEEKQREAPPRRPPAHHHEEADHAAGHGRWALHLSGGMEWAEHESERTLGLALGAALNERAGLDLGFKVGGKLPGKLSQYIGELGARAFPFGREGVRPYLGGGASLRRLSHHGETTLKWGGQALGGVAAPLGGGWQVSLEGGYQRVAAWSGMMDLSGWVGQVGVGLHF